MNKANCFSYQLPRTNNSKTTATTTGGRGTTKARPVKEEQD